MTLNDLFSILKDPDNGVRVEISDTGDLVVTGPNEFINNLPEGFHALVQDFISLALDMGLFLPEEVFTVAKKFVDKDDNPIKGEDY